MVPGHAAPIQSPTRVTTYYNTAPRRLFPSRGLAAAQRWA
jgi:hypothetical protein